VIPELTLGAWLRFDAIHDALKQVRPRTILEIGGGEGALGAWLSQRYDYTGVEPDRESFSKARARLERVGRGRVLQGTLDRVRGHTFDLVCAFEVLEHIEDDARELNDWCEHLATGGFLLLSVPAHSRRFAASDVAVGHVRRYDRESLLGLLRSCGLTVTWLRSWGFPLGLMLETIRNHLAARDPAVPHTIEARTGRSGRWLQPRSRAFALANAVLAYPFRWLQAPFNSGDRGIGWVVLAHREVPARLGPERT